MGIECGSQIAICDVPIRLDTYEGCSHGCKYCFAKRTKDIQQVKPLNCINQLRTFIDGARTLITNWCDWDIPLHWGGMSDPFQPCEEEHRISLNALEVFAETGYPVIISTKGRMIVEPEYIELLRRCNAVVQISMISPRYDAIETGCPTYEERLEICRKVAPNCKRLIVRVQPYTTDVLRDVIDNMPRLKKAGVYGVILEGMKSVKKVEGMVKIGGDYCYPYEVLRSHFEMIRDAAHNCGLAFYSGENRLRAMGDSLTCCGCDGVDGFKANAYNRSHIENGDVVRPTEKMQEIGTATAFRNMFRTTVKWNRIKRSSFSNEMMHDDTVNCCKKVLLNSD